MRTCNTCNTRKEDADFKSRRRCISCYKKSRTVKEYSDRFSLSAKNKALSIEDKRICSKCNTERCLTTEYSSGTSICKSCKSETYNKNKDIVLQKNRDRHYKHTFGITREDLGRCCSICQSEDNLVIDHCHDTNYIRGLLCRPCNAALGIFRDNIDVLNIAREYLYAFQNKLIQQSPSLIRIPAKSKYYRR